MLPLVVCLLLGAEKAPVHLWYEPEWFPGVEGGFAYWPGPAKAAGKWGIAGPGISAEWTQGGESGWNSVGAAADETKASCGREIIIPWSGKYRAWVRYVEHRKKKTPFKLQVGGASREFGVRRALPADDEYLLYWGFAFAWDSFEVELKEGKADLRLVVDAKGEAWRQVDAILLTTDLDHTPVGREKPSGWHDRRFYGSFEELPTAVPAARWARPKLGGRDFALWTGVEADAKWWDKQKVETLRPVDVFYAHSPPADIKAEFYKQYPKPEDVPLINSPHLLPGFYLGHSPDLSPGTSLRKWLERTKSPFYIMTNYASGNYTDKTGPATYAALTGPLKDQFLGYIHGEAIGTGGVGFPEKPFGKTRAEQVAGLAKHLKAEQAKAWGKIYKTAVGEEHWAKGIPCLSVDSPALAHLFYEMGSEAVGYEVDATQPNIPLRMAFLRGAARQYGKPWIHYASGNFGDACNYFTQEPRVPRGAKAWYHSKYSITDGVTAGWYRSLYHLNYYGGASAIYWEQSLENQWLKPGPGTHPIGLSPFGRGTEDFMALLQKGPAPGEPITPVAFLLSHAHGYEPTSYRGRMLHHFHESAGDRELRGLFEAAYYPVGVREGEPASPYAQSMPGGVFGNVFDVLVDRPARIKAIHNYRAVYLTGDVDVAPIKDELVKFVKEGGTLAVSGESLAALSKELTGLKALGKRERAEKFNDPDEDAKTTYPTTPFEVERVELSGATALWSAGKLPLLTRHAVGKGKVIVGLVPRMTGLDERPHLLLPVLLRQLTPDAVPVAVANDDGELKPGDLMVQYSRNAEGIVVTVLNPNGVDKTQNGVARVDRRRAVAFELVSHGCTGASLYEDGKMTPLKVQKRDGDLRGVPLRLGPGSLAVVQLTFKPPR